MEHSEQVNEVLAALSKAQAEIHGAVAAAENPHFKSRYADLTACWEAARPALTKNGLSVFQSPEMNGTEGITVHTLLGHASGQWLKSVCTVPTDKRNAHGVGSAITYARRYGLAAAVGLAPVGDDDDGVKAAQSPPVATMPDGTSSANVDTGAVEKAASSLVDMLAAERDGAQTDVSAVWEMVMELNDAEKASLKREFKTSEYNTIRDWLHEARQAMKEPDNA